MDLSKIIADSISEMQESGKLKEIVDGYTRKTVEGIVQEMFRWGDVHKNLKEAIHKSSCVSPDMLSIPNFQVLIAQQAGEAYREAITKLGLDETRKLVDEFLRIPPEGPLKLSEMVEVLKDSITKDEGNLDEEITLIVEEHSWSKNSYSIYIDPRNECDKHSCRVYLHVSGTILSAKLSGEEYGRSFSSRTKGFLELGYPDRLENLLIHAYTAKREIIVDEDNCNTTIHTHED